MTQVGHEGRGVGGAGIGLLRVGSLESPESEPAGESKPLNRKEGEASDLSPLLCAREQGS